MTIQLFLHTVESPWCSRRTLLLRKKQHLKLFPEFKKDPVLSSHYRSSRSPQHRYNQRSRRCWPEPVSTPLAPSPSSPARTRTSRSVPRTESGSVAGRRPGRLNETVRNESRIRWSQISHPLTTVTIATFWPWAKEGGRGCFKLPCIWNVQFSCQNFQ